MMIIARKLSKLICQVLIGVMLFAQMAVAGYACPGLLGTKSMSMDRSGAAKAALATVGLQEQTATPGATIPGCHQIDPSATNLCAEHCRFGQQSADTAPAPVVFAPVPALVYALPLEPEPIGGSVRSAPRLDPVLAVAPPPHAILHCVFRI